MFWPHLDIKALTSTTRRIGEVFEFSVKMSLSRKLLVNEISATLKGIINGEMCFFSEKYILSHVDEFIEGEYEFSQQVSVSDSFPATLNDRYLDISYELDIHCDIPRWPDWVDSFPLTLLPPIRQLKNEAIDYRGIDSLGRRRPRIVLKSNRFLRNEPIHGGFFLYDFFRGYQKLKISLYEDFFVCGERKEKKKIDSILLDCSFVENSDRRIGFCLDKTQDVHPSYQSPLVEGVSYSYSHYLEIELDVKNDRPFIFEIPVFFNDTKGSKGVMSERQRLWDSVADILGYSYVNDQLIAENESAQLRIYRQEDSDREIIRARFIFKRISKLGLSISSAKFLNIKRIVFDHDIFDRHHHCIANDRTQLKHLLDPIIQNWDESFRLQADDRGIELSTIIKGQEQSILFKVAKMMKSYFAQFSDLRKSMPWSSRDSKKKEVLKDFARLIGKGELDSTRASLWVSVDGLEVEVDLDSDFKMLIFRSRIDLGNKDFVEKISAYEDITQEGEFMIKILKRIDDEERLVSEFFRFIDRLSLSSYARPYR